jgi:hypothetical protein
MAYLAMWLDRLIELLQDCLGVTSDGGNVLARVTTSATSRAMAATMPSYPRSTAPVIAVSHGSWRMVILPMKVVARALAAYSPQRTTIPI